jgi:exopolysaccharide production protein ExoQ
MGSDDDSLGRAGDVRDPGRHWFALCALSVIVASDYKVRVRPVDEPLSGSLDVFIALEVAIYGAVALYLVLSQAGFPKVRRMPTVLYLSCSYVALLAISLIHAPYFSFAVVRVLEVLVILGLTLAAWNRATRADMHRFAHWFLILVLASIAVGILIPMPRFAYQEQRFTWLRLHPGDAAVYLALAVVVSLAYVVSRSTQRPGPRWPHWVYVALLVVNVVALAATITRGAMLGSLTGCAVVVALIYRGRQRILLASGLVAGAVIVFLLAGGPLMAFVIRGDNAQQLATLSSRTELWSFAWEAIQQQPIFGWGIGASRGIFLNDIGLGGGHNALVNVAVDIGLVGAAIWAALIVSLLVTVLRAEPGGARGLGVDRALVLGTMACLLVFLQGLGSVANVAGTWLFVCVAWAVLVGRPDSRRPTHSGRPLLPWRTST